MNAYSIIVQMDKIVICNSSSILFWICKTSSVPLFVHIKMINHNTIIKKLGVDKAIAYTSLNSTLNAIFGVFSVFLYATCLSKTEQGYFYTFGSIMAISVFFELGFTGIMTQYVAHEHAHLSWEKDGKKLVGDRVHLSRLASLLHFCVKWYAIVAFLYLIALQFFGISFFVEFGEDSSISWKVPWIILSSMSAWGLFTAPVFSFMAGLDLVKEMAKMRFYRTIISTIVTWGCLIGGLGLYSMAIASMVFSVYVVLYFLYYGFWKILKNIWITPIQERVNYIKEIFPYQWKISLSWMSGYFIFQFMNPIIFATAGAVAAGQFGMSLNVLNSIRNFSMSWIGTKIPLMSRLIELKNYIQLDKIFRKSVVQEIIVCTTLLVIFWIIIFSLNITQITINGKILGERFLDYLPLLLITIPVVILAVNDNLATYIRCHKKEPYLIVSICAGIANLASVIILGKLFGLVGITAGYCALNILFFPWGYWIYHTCKKNWHNE